MNFFTNMKSPWRVALGLPLAIKINVAYDAYLLKKEAIEMCY